MVQLFKANVDTDKIEKDLNKWRGSELSSLADYLYSTSDEPDDRSGWEDIKDNMDKNSLVSAIVEFFKDHNLTYGELQGMKRIHKASKGKIDDPSELFKQVLEMGLNYDHHASDLYIEDTPKAVELLKRYAYWASLERFLDSDKVAWWDVPFAYDRTIEKKYKK